MQIFPAMKTEVFYSELINLEDNLTRLARSFTSNLQDAKDLVQETFLKALLFKEYFKDDTNLSAWTSIILRNIFINNYRKKNRQNSLLDLRFDYHLINSNPNQTTPESSYLVYEINKTIDSIDEKLHKPFRLYILGYKYKEIAKMLNLKLGTVKSRIFMARRDLMQILRY